MYDASFNRTSLSRLVRNHDFHKYALYEAANGYQTALDRAILICDTEFRPSPELMCEKLGNRKIYRIDDLATELILRKATQNISVITGLKQADRIETISRLRTLCRENNPFGILKVDIKSFFPSLHHKYLNKKCAVTFRRSPSTAHIIQKFLSYCRSMNIDGVPPGLPISSLLSELYMRSFDQTFMRHPSIYYYARFVDDMIFLFDHNLPKKTLIHEISSNLPDNLRLNYNKTQCIYLDEQKRENQHKLSFNYLGYKFTISNFAARNNLRTVLIDIANSKLKKRKTRIVRSFLRYIRDGNSSDLNDRISIIANNYRFYDENSNKYRYAGNYFTYQLLDTPFPALQKLDNFLRHITLSSSVNNSKAFRTASSNSLRKQILAHSFVKGYTKPVVIRFKRSDSEQLAKLIHAWKYA